MDRTVFRLRQIPASADRFDVARLLHEALAIRESAIQICSLAESVDIWVSNQTATLMFEDAAEIEEALQGGQRPNVIKSGENEWRIQLNNLDPHIILDSHFRGLTPLYEPTNHVADCIAISGLASHPFGSWQPKGQSKTYMWLRDALPKALPNIRPILYGYDTTLVGSDSFQSIFDLALSFLEQLKVKGWSSPSSKPIIFVAHSLGGIILKQAFVSLAGHDALEHPLRLAIKGAIFFGVPNFGMKQSSLLTVVSGQANEGLVADLAVNSTYLTHLDTSFSGLSQLQNMSLYWAYETKKSATVKRDEAGKWKRDGPKEILVTPNSATRGMYTSGDANGWIFPIDKDHSSMVKFAEDDNMSSIVTHKILFICQQTPSEGFENCPRVYTLPRLNTNRTEQEGSCSLEEQEKKIAAEQDLRLLEIDERYEKTFEWVYDRDDIGFKNWLQHGSGLFWINGKPGSGKSTFMKFISQNRRTEELLSRWDDSEAHICASFFFHHRGYHLQKSFEGLLRSILFQLISFNPRLCSEISPFVDKKNVSETFWTRIKLQTAFNNILKTTSQLYLTLFLDALDEYDGPIEFICDFLQGISRLSQSPTKNVRVCFSSRPWEIFKSSFRHYPNISLQDFTKEDLRNFCLGSIEMKNINEMSYMGLVSDIVIRSRGVFLWVKLVVKDLHQHIQKQGSSMEGLQSYLDSLPSELDHYYTEIIHRIPLSHRWKTYAMLEIVVRSGFTLEPQDFYGATECSELLIYDHVRDKIQEINSCNIDWVEFVQDYATKYCGGLVEIRSGGRRSPFYIQTLHQTVEDFVKSPSFKQLVLQTRAKVTIDNGHTFLARYNLAQSCLSDVAIFKEFVYRYNPFEAFSSEQTTGQSMRQFLESKELWTMVAIFDHTPSVQTFSPVSAAVQLGLHLTLSETAKIYPSYFRNCKEPLFTRLLNSSVPGFLTEIIGTVQPVMQNGYTIHHEPDAFAIVVRDLSRDNLVFDNRLLHHSEESDLLSIAILFLQSGASPIIEIKHGGHKTGIRKQLSLHT
ncbi:unnamed protein product [Clonostachys rosea]|uniref:Nephrocystin 3-like N-terminal domain-containing protein n=1 Tax=Bionectria ochroleuca TaxID=29856 RepID=A0ABY6UTI9_BIOOC|nr:unnamed protein product [Clonostachys rosea]